MACFLKRLILLITISLCIGQQPADKGANAKTKETLDYIAGLAAKGNAISSPVCF